MSWTWILILASSLIESKFSLSLSPRLRDPKSNNFLENSAKVWEGPSRGPYAKEKSKQIVQTKLTYHSPIKAYGNSEMTFFLIAVTNFGICEQFQSGFTKTSPQVL